MDDQSSARSNWIRFVNCAQNEEEHNLQAYKYCGNIYYRTLKTIEPHTQLLVGYGDHHANQLGISCHKVTIAIIVCEHLNVGLLSVVKEYFFNIIGSLQNYHWL